MNFPHVSYLSEILAGTEGPARFGPDMSNFQRGPSKIFYDSQHTWDPGETDLEVEEAITSFSAREGDFPPPTLAKPVPILGHMMLHQRLNRSAELDDILEESLDEADDETTIHHLSSPSPPMMSSPASSNSPEGSFRLPRGYMTRRSKDSQESTDSSEFSSPRMSESKSKSLTIPLMLTSQHRSQDSGFSDSGDSNQGTGLEAKNSRRAQVQEVHSEVVHETRTNSFDQKPYHVSKVYFYSVSDILSQEHEEQKRRQQQEGHVSVLACEDFRASSPCLPLLSPPRSPPLAPRDSGNPYYDSFHMEHKPIMPSQTTSTQTNSGARRPQSSPNRIHTGTSSLGRSKKNTKKTGMTDAPVPTSFPKTNGSLYESLSLGRPDKKTENMKKRLADVPAAPPSPSLRGMGSSGKGPFPLPSQSTYDGFDDPLSVWRNSIRSLNQSVESMEEHLGIRKSDLDLDSLTTDPVNFWLRELSMVHEAECTIMLQSKPVASLEQDTGSNLRDGREDSPPSGMFWAGNVKDTIRAIQARAHSISAVFAKLCRQLGHRGGVQKLVPLVQGLSHQVHLFLVEYNKYNHLQVSLPGYRPRNSSKSPGKTRKPFRSNGSSTLEIPEEILHQQRLLLQACDKLKLTMSRHQMQQQSSTSMNEIVDVITQLGAVFTKLIELMLSKEIKSSVEALDERSVSDLVALRHSVDSIITLALEGNHLCRLIAKHGGVRSLLTIAVDDRLRNVRVNAFRALGTVCCVLEGIMELEDAGGIQILSDTLRDDNATEEEKSEAAGLLAQVTSPWIENNSSIEGLSRHLSQLVDSLTCLSKNTKSAETFLLSSAALANLTFMEPSVVHLIQKHNSVKVLVDAVREQKAISIYIQDQVAAVLANMAANVDSREEVVKHGGLPILLRFIHAEPPTRPQRPEDFAQMAATERVQQKSAIALSRLCNDPKLAEQVVRLNGLSRLVELCKNESARVGSDGVLVSCLAAVRKISGSCGAKYFEDLDAAELVEPRLLDSFLIFSSKNESFV